MKRSGGVPVSSVPLRPANAAVASIVHTPAGGVARLLLDGITLRPSTYTFVPSVANCRHVPRPDPAGVTKTSVSVTGLNVSVVGSMAVPGAAVNSAAITLLATATQIRPPPPDRVTTTSIGCTGTLVASALTRVHEPPV